MMVGVESSPEFQLGYIWLLALLAKVGVAAKVGGALAAGAKAVGGAVGGGGGGGAAVAATTTAPAAAPAPVPNTIAPAATPTPAPAAPTPAPIQTPIPAEVQAMLKPEATQPQVSQVPTIDLGANASTPSGPIRTTPQVPQGSPVMGGFTDAPLNSQVEFDPGRGSLVQRISRQVEDFGAALEDNEGVELLRRLKRLSDKAPRVEIPQPGDFPGSRSAEQQPSFAPASQVPDLNQSRPQAIRELLADLRLNRRSFG